ncbi:hypothetical protein [Pontibacter sp. G13]|uniref:hypothetical protein n=1 Tax=Pontibacter sp. G13 TaxID=3074898 RepID=UPI00288C2C8C|nr:hypothetical protein [Pontibacter sp. G13]WNJ17070.1 hypothetical protein RJD25_19625 [Pontibacter sp. G13]
MRIFKMDLRLNYWKPLLLILMMAATTGCGQLCTEDASNDCFAEGGTWDTEHCRCVY